MDFDYLAADTTQRDHLIQTWSDVWHNPHWGLSLQTGRHAACQVQFVLRFIEITEMMHDADRRKMANDERNAAKALGSKQ